LAQDDTAEIGDHEIHGCGVVLAVGELGWFYTRW
jgi:hypothetical protein